MPIRLQKLLGVAALVVLGFAFVSKMPSSGDFDAVNREHDLLKCVGAVPKDQSTMAWSSDMVAESKRLGISTSRLAALYLAHAEAKYPGVTQRCKQ